MHVVLSLFCVDAYSLVAGARSGFTHVDWEGGGGSGGLILGGHLPPLQVQTPMGEVDCSGQKVNWSRKRIKLEWGKANVKRAFSYSLH